MDFTTFMSYWKCSDHELKKKPTQPSVVSNSKNSIKPLLLPNPYLQTL